MIVPLHGSAIDGTGLRKLFVPSSGIAWDPAVSRDAGWAVFAVGPTVGAGDMDVDIWRIRLDGSEAVNLTSDSPCNDALPAVSDDGARIVFRSSRGVQPGPDDDRPRTAWPSAIYVMDGDGENVRRLTDADTRETAPAISSNGEWVAYVVHENGVAKIWLRRVDGSEARLQRAGNCGQASTTSGPYILSAAADHLPRLTLLKYRTFMVSARSISIHRSISFPLSCER